MTRNYEFFVGVLLLLVLLPLPSQCERFQANIVLFVGVSDYFRPIIRGFEETCAKTNSNNDKDSSGGTAILSCRVHVLSGSCDDFLAQVQQVVSDADGFALNTKCQSPEFFAAMREWTQTKTAVTYGKDLPAKETGRLVFIGTDNSLLGQTMARLLRQLRPQGGTYATVGARPDNADAFADELQKYNSIPSRAHWHALALPEDMEPYSSGNAELYYPELQYYAEHNPNAIVTLMQSPMRLDNWTAFVEEHRHRDITFVGVDAAEYQLDYLMRGYVHGLIGQMPYEIGATCFTAMYQGILAKHRQQQREHPSSKINEASESAPLPDSLLKIIPPDEHIKTNLIAYTVIPQELPPLDVDENLLGSLAWLGRILFGVVAVMCLACIARTLFQKGKGKGSDTLFLITMAVGVLVFASSLIPLSLEVYEEESSEHSVDKQSHVWLHANTYEVGICMSIPWLAFTGFAILLSALFSKTWRFDRVNVHRAQTVQVICQTDRPRTVSGQRFVILGALSMFLTCNWTILLVWTMWDPLTYVRLEHEGTDYWNRVLSTYGACRSKDGAAAFLVPLAVLNFVSVILCGWQAFRSHHYQTKYDEATYIRLTVASLCQAFLTGIPIALVVRDMPRSFYTVLTLTIFLLSMAVLGLTFGPKFGPLKLCCHGVPSTSMANRGLSRQSQSQLSSDAILSVSYLYNSSTFGGEDTHSIPSEEYKDAELICQGDHIKVSDLTMTSIPEGKALFDPANTAEQEECKYDGYSSEE